MLDSQNPLAAWLAEREMGYEAFARLLRSISGLEKVDRGRIERIAKDERKPGVALALAVEQQTGIPVAAWPDRPVVPRSKHKRHARTVGAGRKGPRRLVKGRSADRTPQAVRRNSTVRPAAGGTR